MQVDDYDLPLSTTSSEAATHLRRGIDGFIHIQADMMTHIDAAIAADPEFNMAHALKGLALASGRNNRYSPLIAAELDRAKARFSETTDRERSYVRALEHASQGQLDKAIGIYQEILDEHPQDILAHRLAQLELFRMGDGPRMRALVERAAPVWSEQVPQYSMFLSVRAFGNEEALSFEVAERCGRAAIELDPTDAWGTHAVAHVLLMQGRYDEGTAWLESLCGNWQGVNQFVHHLWWHLCLFLLEAGDHDRILELFDTKVWDPDSPLVKAVPDLYIDLQNTASLLLRLELRGVDVGDRWQRIEDSALNRIDNNFCPFTSAHAAAVLAANGMYMRADELIQSMQAFAAADKGPLGVAMQKAAIPAATAAVAHRKGDHEAVIAHLLPAMESLEIMGGSHAQRDIFFQLLVDSCHRLGRTDELDKVAAKITSLGFRDIRERSFYADVF